MLLNDKKITEILGRYNINLGRLVKFLQDKQIPIEVIAKVLGEVVQELEEGKKWYLEPLMYPPNYRRYMQEFPDDFWIDNYILERCKMLLDELIESEGVLNRDQVVLSTFLQSIEKQIDKFGIITKYIMRDLDVLVANDTKPSLLRRIWMRLNQPVWSNQTWVWTRNGWRWVEKPKKKKRKNKHERTSSRFRWF